MKIFVFFLLNFGILGHILAQSSVVIDPQNNTSSIIQTKSNTKAIQLPRATNSSSIPNPQVGHIMYNNSTASLNFYDGISWQNLKSTATNFSFVNSVAFKGLSAQNTTTNPYISYLFTVLEGITTLWAEIWSGGTGRVI